MVNHPRTPYIYKGIQTMVLSCNMIRELLQQKALNENAQHTTGRIFSPKNFYRE